MDGSYVAQISGERNENSMRCMRCPDGRLAAIARLLHVLFSNLTRVSPLTDCTVSRAGAKRVYVMGQLVFTVGMTIMAATRHKVAVLLLSPTAGIMYATLFTMPYLLVAHYHTSGLVSRFE